MHDYLRNSRAHVFVPALADEISITGVDHHHLSRVMRLDVDEHITAACDGFVREYIVEQITRDLLVARALRGSEKIDEPEIHVVVSLFKLDRLEMGIAKAIEAGAVSLTIGNTARSPIRLDASKKEKSLRRCEAIARSASMQSRRANLTPVKFVDDIFDHLEKCETPIVICEPGSDTGAPNAPVTIVIGPEGGFDGDEVDRLGKLGTMWTISPYILRADTAMALAPGLVAASGRSVLP